MGLFEEINAARMLLDLPERATMADIKAQYRELIKKWHPDRCNIDKETCKEMTAQIIAAYRLISNYCNNYYLSAEEWWYERFGRSPLWDSNRKSK